MMKKAPHVEKNVAKGPPHGEKVAKRSPTQRIFFQCAERLLLPPPPHWGGDNSRRLPPWKYLFFPFMGGGWAFLLLFSPHWGPFFHVGVFLLLYSPYGGHFQWDGRCVNQHAKMLGRFRHDHKFHVGALIATFFSLLGTCLLCRGLFCYFFIIWGPFLALMKDHFQAFHPPPLYENFCGRPCTRHPTLYNYARTNGITIYA